MCGVAMLLLAGCDSRADSVCEGIADCERGGDSEWLSACQDDAKALGKQADSLGCGSHFDDYYSCADAHFQCNGATASFPSCEGSRAALDACLAAAQGDTACSELSAQTQACTSSTDADAGSTLTPACSLNRDCTAQCYLDHVLNVCAPNAAELSAVTTCAASCPP